MKTLLGAALLAAPSLLFAQGYQVPAAAAGGQQLCTTPGCIGASGQTSNLPLWPWGPPLSAFKGRFVDSSLTRDYQSAPRTYRARAAALATDRDRVYMMLGSTFASWTTANFFSRLGGTLTNAPNHFDTPTTPGEQYLRWDASVYAETDGWQVKTTDGQDRLYGFDWDDRGYVYLAYQAYGWGIVQDNTGGGGGGGKMPLVSQQTKSPVAPVAMLAFKANGKYYVAVGGGSSKCAVYDVESAAAPRLIGTVAVGPYGAQLNYTSTWARTSGGASSIIAALDDNGKIQIYSGQSFVAAANADVIISPSNIASRFKGVTSDGVNFYGIEGGQGVAASLSVIRPTVPGAAGSYTETKYSLPYTLDPGGLRYGAGYLTTWGNDPNGNNVRLYRIGTGAPTEIDLNAYFVKAYTSAPAGYSMPQGYSRAIRDVVMASNNGHDYMIFSDHGIGDVWEIKGRDSVSIVLDRGAGYGTQNPNSPTRNDGPFYGDKITFNTTSTSQNINRVTWDFDNPGASDNSVSSSVGIPVIRQWVGATTTAEAGRARNVKATVAGDNSNFDLMPLTLTAPTARIGIAGTTSLLTASGTIPGVIYGDRFADASDGVVEGHYAVWTADGIPTTTSPDILIPAGSCSAAPHTLNYEARYVPYDRNGTTITPRLAASSHYVIGVSGLTYDVKPFLANIVISNSDASSVTFRDATRWGAGFINGGATPWSVKWQLLNGSGVEVTSQTIASTAGATDSFTVQKTQITNGSQVVLTVSVDPAQIAPASNCNTAAYATSSKSYLLQVPDPVVTKTGCSNVGSPCSLTATSSGAQDMSAWKYSWKIDAASPVTTTVPTYTPNFTAAGSHTVTLTASNAIGSAQAASTFDVAPSLCNGVPKNVAFSYIGTNTQCQNEACQSNTEPIHFSATAFFYTFQTCDSFAWDFGDGGTSTEQSPTHTFATAPSTVKLTVTNSNGSNSYSKVVLGTVTPPPPPPPPCSAIPASTTFTVTYNGSSSGCANGNGKACGPNESVSLRGNAFGYNIQSCDTFVWSFGDGTSGVGSLTSHAYAAAGNYTISLTVTNTAGSRKTATTDVVISGTCPAPRGSLAGLNYRGTTSGCANNSGSTCTPGETIALSTSVFGYNVATCDTFEWDFGDGSALQTTTAPTINHPYTGGSTRTASVTLKNSSGQIGPVRADIPFGPAATAPPTNAQISSVASVAPGVPVTFTGSADPLDQVASWKWTFPGKTDSGRVVTFTFPTEGTFTVTLEAKNSLGSSLATKSITVSRGKPFAFLLPVVAHLAGNQASQWRTDVQIFNPDTGKPVDMTFDFKGTSKTLTLDSSTYVSTDFMASFLKSGCTPVPDCANDAGPVIVRGIASASIPQMWTRTYNEASSGVGTYGQLIPAVAIDSSQNSSTSSTSYIIPSVENSARYRTNLGLVNPSNTATNLTVTAYDDRNGIAIGGFVATVNPYALMQIGDLPNRIAGLPTNRSYSIRISNPSGAPLMAYASTIDNISNDPVFISASPDTVLRDAAMQKQLVPGVGHLTNGNWKSDVTIFNADALGIQLDLTYYDQAGAKLAEAKNVGLAANTFLHLEDLVQAGVLSPQLTTDSYGTLVVETKSAGVTKYPVVTARTYSDQLSLGTFGQGIPAFAASKANVQPGKSAFIAGVRNDPKFKTNFGLVNASAQPARVKITLLDRTTGAALGVMEYPTDTSKTLAPYEALIQPSVFDAMNVTADRATLKVEVTTGGPVWAYASIIDKTTFDPEYVPAEPSN